MGGRRRGGGPALLARKWPHQVALLAERVVAQHPDILASCAGVGVAPMPHAIRDGDCDYVVFCFSDAADAAGFAARWGGEAFDPRCKGRGARWYEWHRTTGGKGGRNG